MQKKKSSAHNETRDADDGSKLRRIFHVCRNLEDNGSAPGSIQGIVFPPGSGILFILTDGSEWKKQAHRLWIFLQRYQAPPTW